jgi:hypothetical protein
MRRMGSDSLAGMGDDTYIIDDAFDQSLNFNETWTPVR